MMATLLALLVQGVFAYSLGFYVGRKNRDRK